MGDIRRTSGRTAGRLLGTSIDDPAGRSVGRVGGAGDGEIHDFESLNDSDRLVGEVFARGGEGVVEDRSGQTVGYVRGREVYDADDNQVGAVDETTFSEYLSGVSEAHKAGAALLLVLMPLGEVHLAPQQTAPDPARSAKPSSGYKVPSGLDLGSGGPAKKPAPPSRPRPQPSKKQPPKKPYRETLHADLFDEDLMDPGEKLVLAFFGWVFAVALVVLVIGLVADATALKWIGGVGAGIALCVHAVRAAIVIWDYLD